MKPNQKYLIVALSFFFVSSLLLLYVNYFVKKPEVIVNQAFTPTPTSVQWQTYQNEKYGFEFSYPSNFTPQECTSTFCLNKTRVINNRISPLHDFRVRIIPNTKASNYQKILINDAVFDGSGMHPKSFDSFKKQKIGKNDFYFIETGLFEGILSANYYYINENNIIIFELTDNPVDWTNQNFSISDSQLNQKVIQILSTFKFTSKNSDDNQIVKVYYHNVELDPNFENIVANDYKEISIPKTLTPLKDAINELLKTFVVADEKNYGSRVTNFKLTSAQIINGTAKLMFSDPEFYTSGGSTRVNLIYSQIEKTALQFPTVKKVEITGAVFQP